MLQAQMIWPLNLIKEEKNRDMGCIYADIHRLKDEVPEGENGFLMWVIYFWINILSIEK